MKRIMILLSILGFNMLATACNTMEGLGEDVQAGGEKLEESADENKKY